MGRQHFETVRQGDHDFGSNGEGKLFVNQEADEKQGRKLLPTSSKSDMCVRSNKKVNAV